MTYILVNTHAQARHMYVAYVENVTCVCNLDSGHGNDARTKMLYWRKTCATYILENTHAHCTTYVSCLRAERDLCV